ncbi:MAG: GntR family transcriptional regulator [Burkholderiaceae bacterium]
MATSDELQESTTDRRLPLYQQLKDLFVAKIRDGAWSDAAPIPSEIELAAMYGVAPGTVRRAIDDLVAARLLVRQQGRGTFVRDVDLGNALFRFFRFTDAKGQALLPSARILSRRETEADREEREHLALARGARVLRLERVRLVRDEPLLFEKISVDAHRFKPLARIEPGDFGDLLYPLYQAACGIRILRAVETIRFGTASAGAARHLRAGTGTPVAIIERQAFDLDEQATEWRVSQALASRFSYSVELR